MAHPQAGALPRGLAEPDGPNPAGDAYEQSADADLSARYENLQDDEDVSIDKLSSAHSEILGEIGFSWEPKHVDEVLDRIINRATGKAPTLADVMEVHRKRGEADAAATTDGKTLN
jgi:hypothetical protein